MFKVPNITKNLLIINLLAFLATIVLKQSAGIDLNDLLGLHFFKAESFQIYQLVTYMFMHGGWQHIILNMFMLWMFGSVVEHTWGPRRFLIYYLVCGIGAGLCQEVAQYIQYSVSDLAAYDKINLGGMIISTEAYLNMWTTVGASGAIYALLLAFGMMFPNERMFIIPIPIPIKAKWLVLGSIIVEFVASFGSGDGVAHVAHLGGMLFGFFLIRYWMKHPNHYFYTGGGQLFSKMRTKWEEHTGKSRSNRYERTENSDWEYNARKKKEQEEIDRILDKIRKSGYDSLTTEEKRKLFEQGK